MSTWSDTRLAALDTALAWIRHWSATTGVAHADARTEAQAALTHYRRFHRDPERRAFAAAVARSKQRTRKAA